VNTLKKYGLFGLIAIAGILIGRYVIQPKSEVKTKEVIKYVEVYKEKKEEKKNVKIVVVEKPDGTKTTTTTDNSTTSTVSNGTTKIDSKNEVTIKKGSGLTLGALAIANASRFSDKLEYGVTAAIPVFGNLKAQALITTDKRVGLGLAIEF
jgi:hypothetical protein